MLWALSECPGLEEVWGINTVHLYLDDDVHRPCPKDDESGIVRAFGGELSAM